MCKVVFQLVPWVALRLVIFSSHSNAMSFVPDDTSVVKYGKDPSAWSVVTANITKTYTAADMCAAPANGVQFVDPGFIHDVLLTDLSPGTRYYYTYGSEKVTVYNETFNPTGGGGTMHFKCRG